MGLISFFVCRTLFFRWGRNCQDMLQRFPSQRFPERLETGRPRKKNSRLRRGCQWHWHEHARVFNHLYWWWIGTGESGDCRWLGFWRTGGLPCRGVQWLTIRAGWEGEGWGREAEGAALGNRGKRAEVRTSRFQPSALTWLFIDHYRSLKYRECIVHIPVS